MRAVRLRDIAHARAGDKGDTSNISLWVRDPADYAEVKAQVTPERVSDAFPGQLKGTVERYQIDRLHGLNFVLTHALEGGVNGSLNLDGHGKSFSYILLDIEVQLAE